MAGAGAVGVVIGVVAGLMANSDWNNAKRICGGDVTSCLDKTSADPFATNARADASVSTAAFIAGGALLAGGAVTYFTAREHRERTTGTTAVAPSIEPQRVGIVLKGAFW